MSATKKYFLQSKKNIIFISFQGVDGCLPQTNVFFLSFLILNFSAPVQWKLNHKYGDEDNDFDDYEFYEDNNDDVDNDDEKSRKIPCFLLLCSKSLITNMVMMTMMMTMMIIILMIYIYNDGVYPVCLWQKKWPSLL